MAETERKREVWMDWMRVTACFLVMLVHSTEPFYLGGDGTLILTRADAFWASLFDSFARACVPIFIVASSYLQFPIHYSTGEFFRRRVVRILVPFVIWTLVYALVWGEPVQNFKGLLLNFQFAAGHLWFVYMLIGLYILMPLLSPWAERVGKRELLFFIALFLFTTFIPFIRERAAAGGTQYFFCSDGSAIATKYPLWGEALWNDFGTFYYISGFIGYLLIGLYLRKFVGPLGIGRTLAVALPCWICGFAICAAGFFRRAVASAVEGFPVGGDIGLAAGWETPWTYNSTGVVLMTVGWVLLFRLISSRNASGGAFFKRVVLPVSKAGYGMYLCHMFALASFSSLFRGVFGLGADGRLGIATTPVEILLTAVCSFVTVALVCVLLRKIPKVGRWIIG